MGVRFPCHPRIGGQGNSKDTLDRLKGRPEKEGFHSGPPAQHKNGKAATPSLLASSSRRNSSQQKILLATKNGDILRGKAALQLLLLKNELQLTQLMLSEGLAENASSRAWIWTTEIKKNGEQTKLGLEGKTKATTIMLLPVVRQHSRHGLGVQDQPEANWQGRTWQACNVSRDSRPSHTEGKGRHQRNESWPKEFSASR